MKLKNGLPFLILYVLISGVFFWILKDKLLFTPDFGQSDAFHYNLSSKYFIWQNLSQGRIPFWTELLQGGYPFIAESQSGMFYIPTILFLSVLPFVYGYNLLFIFSFCISAIGMFLVFRLYKLNSVLAFLLSFSFVFNGAYLLRATHLNLILSFSLFPFLFYTYELLYRGKSKWFTLLFVFLLSQMIYAGHNQAVFVSVFGLFLYHLLRVFTSDKPLRGKIISLAVLLGLIVGGYTVALPQILMTVDLSSMASRTIQLDFETATLFPFSWSNILNFAAPYVFGNPSIGTYPPFSSAWGIFWENTPYIGLCVAGLVIVCIFLIWKPLFKEKDQRKILLLVIGILIFLALGKNSPLYFIFNFSPFDFYRVPSKFLLPAVFFVFLFLSISLSFIGRKRKLAFIIISFLLTLNLIELILFGKTYHLFLDAKKVLSPPMIAKYIDNSIYFSVDTHDYWNSIFLKKGWNDAKDADSYLFLKNLMYPNSNLMYGKKSLGINSPGFQLKRVGYLQTILYSTINKTKDNTLQLSNSSYPLMELLGVKYIVSTDPVDDARYKRVVKATKGAWFIYLQSDTRYKDQEFYIPKKINKISYLEEFTALAEKGVDFRVNAVVEDAALPVGSNENDVSVTVLLKSEREIKLATSAPRETFLVLKKNYYPEWVVTIDKKQSSLYRTNLVHSGILVPKGTHIIHLYYENRGFKKGIVFSVVGLTVLLALLLSRLKIFQRIIV